MIRTEFISAALKENSDIVQLKSAQCRFISVVKIIIKVVL